MKRQSAAILQCTNQHEAGRVCSGRYPPTVETPAASGLSVGFLDLTIHTDSVLREALTHRDLEEP